MAEQGRDWSGLQSESADVRRSANGPSLTPAHSAVFAGAVLVVDDEAECLSLARRVIEREGHEVVCSDRPDMVPALVGTLRPKLVMLDILMPDFDGWDVLAALKSDPATRGVSVVMISVLDEGGRARQQGADGFILKPIDRDKIRDILGTGAPIAAE